MEAVRESTQHSAWFGSELMCCHYHLPITTTKDCQEALLAQTRFRYVSLSNFTFILQLTSQEEFWAWTHTELLPTLFPSSWYNGADRQPDGFLADHYSQLVGGARMRLLRAKTGTFQDATELNIVFCGMLKNVTAWNRGKLLLVPSRVGMEFPFVSAFVLQMSLVDPRYDK